MAVAVVHSLSVPTSTRQALEWVVGALILAAIGAWAFNLGQQRFFQRRRRQ